MKATYYDKFTNQQLGWMSAVDGETYSQGHYKFGSDYVGKTIGDYINDKGTYSLRTLIPQISGYKYTGDLNQLKQTVITGDHQTLNLEYTKLAPVYVRYIDSDNGKVLAVLDFHVPLVGLATNYDDTNADKGDSFETLPVDPSAYTEIGDQYQANIPGYTYTGQHSAVTSGELIQVQKSATDKNPIFVDYLYKVSDPVVAKYTREHPQLGKAPRFDLGPIFGFIGDKFDYPLAYQNLKKYLTDNGVAFVGGVAIHDGYLNKTANAPYFYFLGNRDVKVNYINEATGEVMKTVSATPARTTTEQNKNPYFGHWTSSQLSFDGLYFDKVDRSTSGLYGIFAQEVNYYYLPIVDQKTEKKTVKRIVHFVADNDNHDQLQDDKTQQVTYTTTFFADKDGKLVNAKAVKDASGKTIYVVDLDNQQTPQKTWTVEDTQGASLNDGQASYNQVKQDQVDVPSGALKGHWVIEKAAHDTVDGQLITTKDAPTEKISNDIADGTVENVYLIYDLTHSHDEQMTFTRQVNYQGTKDGGKTYETVNGSPEGKSSYQQTVVFTRHVVQDSRGNVISRSPWTSQGEMTAVVSQRPGQVGYEMVDIDQVDAETINPKDYQYTGKPIDLRTTTVTYRTNVAQDRTVARHIYYRDAQTGEKITDELAKHGIQADVPDITQTVNYTRLAVYDPFGVFLGYAQLETNPDGLAKLNDGKLVAKKGADGQPLIAGKGTNDGWVPVGLFIQYPAQGSPDLTKYGYKKAQSFEQKQNNDDAAEVGSHQSTPAHDGADVNVYYFHDQQEVDGNHPGVDPDQLTKTFTRTIVYQGTRDHGQSYQDVNGSPTGTQRYVQTLTFTRKAIIDSVTHQLLGYTDWTADQSSFAAVDSQNPATVGYQTVDRPEVSALAVDPNSDQTDLGTVVVTYQAEPQPVGEAGTNQPGTLTGKKTEGAVPTTKQQPDTKQDHAAQELPQTGNDHSAALAGLGLLGLMMGFGLGRKKRD